MQKEKIERVKKITVKLQFNRRAEQPPNISSEKFLQKFPSGPQNNLSNLSVCRKERKNFFQLSLCSKIHIIMKITQTVL